MNQTLEGASPVTNVNTGGHNMQFVEARGSVESAGVAHSSKLGVWLIKTSPFKLFSLTVFVFLLPLHFQFSLKLCHQVKCGKFLVRQEAEG